MNHREPEEWHPYRQSNEGIAPFDDKDTLFEGPENFNRRAAILLGFTLAGAAALPFIDGCRDRTRSELEEYRRKVDSIDPKPKPAPKPDAPSPPSNAPLS